MHMREVASLESNVSSTTAVNAPHVVLFWQMFTANQPKAIFMSTTYGSCPKSEKATRLILSVTYLPVCPNCHAVIHMRKPPYSIQEIENLIHAQKENANNALHTDATQAQCR